jgi:hypothetical protein
MADLALRCRCGKVRGVVLDASPRNGRHVVCYCDDCRAYARWLGTDGILDAHGGSDLYQTAPARVRIDEGTAELRCVRLSERGMLRWYAGCCRTPIGNTLTSARSPFVGLVQPILGAGREEAIGPAAGVQARFALNGKPEGAHETVSFGVIAGTIGFLLRSALTGGHRPSPFFDPATGKPLVEPEILTPEARAALRD